MSYRLLTLSPRHSSLTVGDMVEFLCESQRRSPPILYNSTLMGRSLGSLWWSGLLIFLVTSEKDAGNYICEAENSISRERSQAEILSLDGTSCTPAGSELHMLSGVRPHFSMYLPPCEHNAGPIVGTAWLSMDPVWSICPLNLVGKQ